MNERKYTNPDGSQVLISIGEWVSIGVHTLDCCGRNAVAIILGTCEIMALNL